VEMQEELLTVPQKAPPFNFVKYYDPVNLLDILKLELPQTIALILAHMELEKAAIILKNLPGDIEGDVLRRIATLNTVDSCFIQEIEQTLEKKLSSMG
jgi:flagellar motor switch protein FliG